MRIKKLSLLGFKSFMDRLEITFPEGISGVVGPNGCGKSNIVDAIRWCMGEQSPKQLRGRRMEDVIFNGAGEKKPLGMAEVSIVFENGAGSFPPAFAMDPEISLTRRLYRSGESEYLINRIPCRLKDIQEIFMDTGLGNKAYSIIGQGQIGSILEQKPEDTRVMLEEAAGITKYRKKVEVSQRKIEATESNLQRVEDILGEVQKQMRSLKRQAAKARRYKALGEKINNLELSLHANTYHQFTAELGNKQNSTDDLVQQEIARSTELSGIQSRIEELNIDIEAKDGVLAELRQEYMNRRDKVHRNESALESLAGEIKIQEELEGKLSEEDREIQRRLDALKEEREAIQNKIDQMDGAFGEREAEIALKKKRLQARRDFLKEIKAEFEDARARLTEGKNKELGLNHESGYLNKMLGQITDARSRLEKEVQEIRGKMDSVVRASERKSRAREATASRLEEINGSLEAQRAGFEELERIRDRVETELKTTDGELHASRSRLSSLESLAENFEGYKKGVRSIMRAKDMESFQNRRILGLLADSLQVDSRYEQAVEAVLADKLQYVVVESQEDGLHAVNFLKEEAKGRGSFAPLAEMKQNGAHEGNAPPFPSLADVVSVSDPYRMLTKVLLGNALLVDDLQTALDAWKKGQNGFCYVTPEGDMVDSTGVISGGRLSQTSHGLLRRKREISELKKETEQKQKTRDDLAEQLENVEADLEERHSELEALKEEKWKCQDEINDLDKALFRLGQEVDQMERYRQRITEDLDRKTVEHRKHTKELSRIEDELQQRKASKEKEEDYFREKEVELTECEGECERFRDELTDLQSDFRLFEEERRGLSREIDHLDQYARESVQRRERIQQELDQGREKVREAREKRERIQDELGELREQLEAAEQRVAHADHERQEIRERIKALESREGERQKEIAQLKEDINRARMEHSEIRFKMKNLEELVQDRFGLDLPDVYPQYVTEDFSFQEVEGELRRQKGLRDSMGDVNLTAIKEHEALKERHEFITSQREDLVRSIEDLQTAIRKINKTSLEKFRNVFTEVDSKLKEIFPILFNGGTAALRLTDESRPLESGVLVEVQPPGKRLSYMGLLSGGEKALVAMALLFAIYMIKPSPFCLLDEVDAPLDDANIDRFNNLLREIRRTSQIIMVTHSKRTMEIMDRLYGVTMEKAGISKTVTVDIQNMGEENPEDPPVFQAVLN